MRCAIHKSGIAAFLALMITLSSCAHTPDTHVHATVFPISEGITIVVEGRVIDAKTSHPVPHADIYLIDVQPENWEHLDQYSARLGTANSEGQIDLAAKWTTTSELGGDPVFMPGCDRLNNTGPLVAWAEERCRAGAPGNIAFAIGQGRYETHYVLFDSAELAPQSDGTLNIALGQVALQPRPASDFLLYESIKGMLEGDGAESAEEDAP